MIRDKFKLVKSFARFPFDFFMDVTGKDTVGDVVKTGFLTAGKAMKALSEEKEDRDIYQMDLAKSLMGESPSNNPTLSPTRQYPFTNPELITKIRNIVRNTNNNELRQIIDRFAGTPNRVRRKSKNIGIEGSTVKGVST